MTISASNYDPKNDEYNAFLDRLRDRFNTITQGEKVTLFTTDAENLYSIYLENLNKEIRRHHTCHACRRFIDVFGGLVVINNDGNATPVMWDAKDAAPENMASIAAIEKAVSKARVTGVFYSSEKTWGTPATGDWTHIAVTPPKSLIFRVVTRTPFQASAEKREDFGTVCRALAEYQLPVIEQAINLLKAETLYRSEKFLGVAQWLKDLHTARAKTKNKMKRDNITWLFVALAPAGFCHPRSSMIGTLLDDLAAGLSFADVKAKFDAKMHPLKYMRPQSEPDAGNIAQAEKIIQQLDAAGSLARRYARLDEVISIWMPKQESEQQKASGIFSHLKKDATGTVCGNDMPPIAMTWDKFSRTVLPDALKIELYIPVVNENYTALVTAENADAPPILQWDFEDDRNPVNWYVYPGGSSPSRWGLKANAYCTVDAVTLNPSQWKKADLFTHKGQAAIFILHGARDNNHDSVGCALFPEVMKSDFHGIRKTIEAYSRRARISGYDESSACGLKLQKGLNWRARLRVTTSTARNEYLLDRWD